jgi:NADH-quinone oxidoreductase subunit C
MTVALSAKEITALLNARFAGAVEEAGSNAVLVKNDSLVAVADYLKNGEGLKYDYLNYVTAVDYFSYFEIVYQVTSLEFNKSVIFKARTFTRDNPSVPSVYGVWRGADLQEREIYDLFGVSFPGHPNMKRIFLWDGFPGYPLRKDWNQR